MTLTSQKHYKDVLRSKLLQKGARISLLF